MLSAPGAVRGCRDLIIFFNFLWGSWSDWFVGPRCKIVRQILFSFGDVVGVSKVFCLWAFSKCRLSVSAFSVAEWAGPLGVDTGAMVWGQRFNDLDSFQMF